MSTSAPSAPSAPSASSTPSASSASSASGSAAALPVADGSNLPPVAEIGIAALVLVVASGVYLAAQAQRHPSLVPPITGLVLAGVLVVMAAVMLARVRAFAWRKFKMVFGWALLEYAVIAGLLVYVFVADHIPGGTLVMFVAALVIFAVDIPMMFGFSVARYQPADQ